MKKLFKLCSLLLATSMLLAILPLNSLAIPSNKTIVAFGDSLTALGSPTYVGYLSDILGVDVINSGVGGDTTYLGYQRFQKDVLDKNPDIVLICFGMNDQAMDLVYNQNFMNIESYEYYLSYFTETLQARGVDVIFITPNPVEENYYKGEETYTYNYEGSMDRYCNAMREVAAKYNCDLIDLNYEFNLVKASDYNTFKSYYSTDGIHQSQAGRQFWANKIGEYFAAAYDNTKKATMTVKCVDENGKTIDTDTYVGATGANITLATPNLPSYTTTDADVKTTFQNGKTVTFTYSSDLEDVLKKVDGIDVTQYSEAVLSEIRDEYKNATKLLSQTELDFDAMASAADNINEMLAVKGEEALTVSKGAKYERTAPNYYKWDPTLNNGQGGNGTELNEVYADDFVRLTDGAKGFYNGGSEKYSAWTSNVEVIIDLGEVKGTNIYNGYFACGIWGISVPSNMKISYSQDKAKWTDVNGSLEKTLLNDTDSWDIYKYTVTSKEIVEARYIKFYVNVYGTFVWADEFEAAISSQTVKNAIPVKGVDGEITDDVKVFTQVPENLANSDNIVVTQGENGSVVVSAVNVDEVSLDDGALIIAAGSNQALANAKVGQTVEGFGLDSMVAAYITLSGEGKDPVDELILGDVNNSGAIDMMDYILLKRNYFGTFAFNDSQLKAGDVNHSCAIDMMDYILLKRAYFGTFTLA